MRPATLYALLASFFLCVTVRAQVELVDAQWLTRIKSNKTDTVYVVNFWATWCKPCVDELPYFEQLHANFRNKKVKVIMVSCDFKKHIDTKLIPFIRNKNMQTKVVFMDEANPDTWIDKVDRRWSGAIPATLIICGKKNYLQFIGSESTYEQLEKSIRPLIN